MQLAVRRQWRGARDAPSVAPRPASAGATTTGKRRVSRDVDDARQAKRARIDTRPPGGNAQQQRIAANLRWAEEGNTSDYDEDDDDASMDVVSDDENDRLPSALGAQSRDTGARSPSFSDYALSPPNPANRQRAVTREEHEHYYADAARDLQENPASYGLSVGQATFLIKEIQDRQLLDYRRDNRRLILPRADGRLADAETGAIVHPEDAPYSPAYFTKLYALYEAMESSGEYKFLVYIAGFLGYDSFFEMLANDHAAQMRSDAETLIAARRAWLDTNVASIDTRRAAIQEASRVRDRLTNTFEGALVLPGLVDFRNRTATLVDTFRIAGARRGLDAEVSGFWGLFALSQRVACLLFGVTGMGRPITFGPVQRAVASTTLDATQSLFINTHWQRALTSAIRDVLQEDDGGAPAAANANATVYYAYVAYLALHDGFPLVPNADGTMSAVTPYVKADDLLEEADARAMDDTGRPLEESIGACRKIAVSVDWKQATDATRKTLLVDAVGDLTQAARVGRSEISNALVGAWLSRILLDYEADGTWLAPYAQAFASAPLRAVDLSTQPGNSAVQQWLGRAPLPDLELDRLWAVLEGRPSPVVAVYASILATIRNFRDTNADAAADLLYETASIDISAKLDAATGRATVKFRIAAVAIQRVGGVLRRERNRLAFDSGSIVIVDGKNLLPALLTAPEWNTAVNVTAVPRAFPADPALNALLRDVRELLVFVDLQHADLDDAQRAANAGALIRELAAAIRDHRDDTINDTAKLLVFNTGTVLGAHYLMALANWVHQFTTTEIAAAFGMSFVSAPGYGDDIVSAVGTDLANIATAYQIAVAQRRANPNAHAFNDLFRAINAAMARLFNSTPGSVTYAVNLGAGTADHGRKLVRLSTELGEPPWEAVRRWAWQHYEAEHFGWKRDRHYPFFIGALQDTRLFFGLYASLMEARYGRRIESLNARMLAAQEHLLRMLSNQETVKLADISRALYLPTRSWSGQTLLTGYVGLKAEVVAAIDKAYRGVATHVPALWGVPLPAFHGPSALASGLMNAFAEYVAANITATSSRHHPARYMKDLEIRIAPVTLTTALQRLLVYAVVRRGNDKGENWTFAHVPPDPNHARTGIFGSACCGSSGIFGAVRR